MKGNLIPIPKLILTPRYNVNFIFLNVIDLLTTVVFDNNLVGKPWSVLTD